MVTDDTTAGDVDMTLLYSPTSGTAPLPARLQPPGRTALRAADLTDAEAPLVHHHHAVGRFQDDRSGDRLTEIRLQEARATLRAAVDMPGHGCSLPLPTRSSVGSSHGVD